MIQLERIDSVFLPVNNIVDAVEWYRNKLGLNIAWQNECVACFNLGETPLTLLQQSDARHSAPSDQQSIKPNTPVAFNFYVKDIEQAHQDLASKAV